VEGDTFTKASGGAKNINNIYISKLSTDYELFQILHYCTHAFMGDTVGAISAVKEV
jgi:hypothetical protein